MNAQLCVVSTFAAGLRPEWNLLRAVARGVLWGGGVNPLFLTIRILSKLPKVQEMAFQRL
jgi:hypothetical protein